MLHEEFIVTLKHKFKKGDLEVNFRLETTIRKIWK